MMSRYGNHFERSAIMNWLSDGNSYCPVTGNPLRPSMLISDKTLQWKIHYWAKKNGYDLGTGEEKESDEDVAAASLKMGWVAVPHEHFKCALTQEVMTDPMTSKQGINFERKAILEWLDDHDVCPITKKPLTPEGLIPNGKLKWEIDQWQLSTGDSAQLMSDLELEGKLSKAMMISREVPLQDIVRALAADQAASINADSKPAAAPSKKLAKEDVLSALDDIVDIL